MMVEINERRMIKYSVIEVGVLHMTPHIQGFIEQFSPCLPLKFSKMKHDIF